MGKNFKKLAVGAYLWARTKPYEMLNNAAGKQTIVV